MKRIVSGLVIAAVASLGVAHAEGGVYSGIYFSSHTSDYMGDEFSPSSVGGRLGYQNFFSEYGNGTGLVLGGEVRFATGASNSSIKDGNNALELDSSFGAYLRAGYSTGIVTPYFIAGFSALKGHYHDVARGYNSDFDDDSGSFGIGLDYNINERANIGIEYMQFIEELSETGEALDSLSVVSKFQF